MAANPAILRRLADSLHAKAGELDGTKPAVTGPVIPVAQGVPGLPPGAAQIAPGKTPLDTTADLRDSINALVGSGLTKRGVNRDIDAEAARIMTILGRDAGQKLLTHIQVYNAQASGNPTQRLTRFYDVNSSHPGTQELLQKVKSFGTGPITGFKESTNVANQQLAQGLSPTAPIVVKQ